jgi:predicted RNase H-like nuclease (RuvC/YqgF family)
MKLFCSGLLVALLPTRSVAVGSPVAKAIELLSGLETKITEEGAEAKKAFAELSDWCDDTAKNLEFEIKTGTSEVESLRATIEQETSTASALSTKLEELSVSIAANEADLKAATTVRGKEASDFAAEEKELTEIISTLERATGILEKSHSGAVS